LGREAGGWTWDDEINFGFEAPKENFSQALGVFHEALHDLQFEKQWFEDEKRVVLQEMHQGLEEPRNVLEETWDAVAFDAHPYGRPVIGTEEAILALDMNATEHYYRERFTPNHMIVSVAGDFDEAAMLKQLEEAWGKSAKGPDSFELGIVEPEQKGPRRRTEFLAEATSAMVLQGFVTKGGADADTPAMQLLAELMNHPSFGLPQFLQQQEIWVSDVSAYHGAMKDFGTFKVYARVDPAKEAAVESFVEKFMYDFDARSLPKDAFETTRAW
jgi:zinc protease